MLAEDGIIGMLCGGFVSVEDVLGIVSRNLNVKVLLSGLGVWLLWELIA